MITGWIYFTSYIFNAFMLINKYLVKGVGIAKLPMDLSSFVVKMAIVKLIHRKLMLDLYYCGIILPFISFVS